MAYLQHTIIANQFMRWALLSSDVEYRGVWSGFALATYRNFNKSRIKTYTWHPLKRNGLVQFAMILELH